MIDLSWNIIAWNIDIGESGKATFLVIPWMDTEAWLKSLHSIFSKRFFENVFWKWGYGVLKLVNVHKKSFKRVQVTSCWWSFCNRKGIRTKQSMYCKRIKKDPT